MPDKPDVTQSLEERKFQLELDRFEFEKSKSRGLGFFNSNFGIIITTIVGLATVTVSYLQLKNSNQSGAAQLRLQKVISDAQQALEKSKAQAEMDGAERTLQFNIAQLLLQRQGDINTEDLTKINYLRDVVMSTLPEGVGLKITQKMAENAPNDQIRSAWADGYVKLNATVIAAQIAAPRPPTPPLTAQRVMAQFPQITPGDKQQRVTDILDAIGTAGLSDSAPVIMAYALFETSFFAELVESLNYATAQRIVQTWPATFKSASEAQPFVNNPVALANKAYAGRFGNTEPDDGYKYRGRGYLGTTGRAGYQKAGDLIGVNLVADPDKLMDSKVAAKELVANFAMLGKPITVESAVRKLNGGFFGIAGVQAIYQKLAPGTPNLTEALTLIISQQRLPSQ